MADPERTANVGEIVDEHGTFTTGADVVFDTANLCAWTRASYGEVEFSAWARLDALPQNLNAYSALTGHA